MDVISFGEEDVNQEKLEAFINAVNKEDLSHLVVIPSGSGVLSDSLLYSPVLGEIDAAGRGAAAGGGANFSEYGGIDPSADPELAMVRPVALLFSVSHLTPMYSAIPPTLQTPPSPLPPPRLR